jgi:predicted  nucleic acid-binding Zn-ribbon protein
MKSISKEQIDTLIRIQELEKQACFVNAKLNDVPKKLEALDLNLETSKEAEYAMESELKGS